MNLKNFVDRFERRFSVKEIKLPRSHLGLRLRRKVQGLSDPCGDVHGMASPKKLKLLSFAVSQLPLDQKECYFEVGTFQGKSLIAALKRNRNRLGIACDDFSEFSESAERSLSTLTTNLSRHGVIDRVKFYNEPFQSLMESWLAKKLPPVGVYFYDGAHDELSQYTAIKKIEPILSDEAIVIIDDWRHAQDSPSYAEAGTKRAIMESNCQWDIRWELPARHNGDVDMWWNGVAVLTFRR